MMIKARRTVTHIYFYHPVENGSLTGSPVMLFLHYMVRILAIMFAYTYLMRIKMNMVHLKMQVMSTQMQRFDYVGFINTL